MLLDGPCTGYEIKSLMGRSTAYFWRKIQDSTILSNVKTFSRRRKGSIKNRLCWKKKERDFFTVTEAGREEFKAWLESSTGLETARNEFLLKLFFVTDRKEVIAVI